MKIPDYNGPKFPEISRTEKQSVQKKSISESSENGDISTKDSVKISSEGEELQKTHQAILSQSEFNAGKVAEIKSQMEKGQYKIDPERIANSIIRETLLNRMRQDDEK